MKNLAYLASISHLLYIKYQEITIASIIPFFTFHLATYPLISQFHYLVFIIFSLNFKFILL